MLDLVNAFACSVMMLLLYPIAIVMHHAGYWPHRLALIAIGLIMALQTVAPAYGDFLPDANVLQVVFNLVLAVVVVLSRREIMVIVRLTVGMPPEDPDSTSHPMRRVSDIPAEMLSRVSGRGKP